MRTVAVIPARLGSSRLKNKVLLDICGKTMLEWVWHGVRSARVDEVFIATDSAEVQKVAEEFGAQVVMTSSECQSGTDRIIEALQGREFDIVVNVQGDEPLISGADIDMLVQGLAANTHADVATLVASCPPREFNNPNTVKVVVTNDNRALYFSRAPIPYFREGYTEEAECLKHIGIYAYRRESLQAFGQLPVSQLERIEKLEQLRLMQAGHTYVCLPCTSELHGVDTLEDLQDVEAILSQRLR